MILARCPACSTTFRVTPEQLKARSGMVRCGQCKTVFNALDALVDEAVEKSPSPAPRPPTETAAIATELQQASLQKSPNRSEFDGSCESPDEPEDAEEPAAEQRQPDDGRDAASIPAAPPLEEPEAALLEAQAAGLVAARETREVPGYNKWAERPLAGLDSSFAATTRSPRWPALSFALLLGLGLLAQIGYQARSEIAARWPETRPWLLLACAEIGCEIPLPRQAELISIEGSELQADAARSGYLVLQATLRNRAAFAQAYPALELSLTDTQDALVVRRVLAPRDYLPAKSDPTAAFAANADLAVRLWIDAKDTGASGYRLYVFYP